MKTALMVAFAVGAMCVSPQYAVSKTNYGFNGPNKAVNDSMIIFCDQAWTEQVSFGHQMTGALKKLCD
jgi:hypothetical protein